MLCRGVWSRCCGLDVHKSSISACILLREAGRVQKHQRRFGAMTQDLHELAEWLRQFGVTQVAMESSGVSWERVASNHTPKEKLGNEPLEGSNRAVDWSDPDRQGNCCGMPHLC
jgi:Transposase